MLRSNHVVEAVKQALKLGNDDVFIVSGIANNRTFGVFRCIADLVFRCIADLAARQIPRLRVGSGSAQWLSKNKATTIFVEIGLIVGSAAIDIIEIKSWGAIIHQRVGIVLFLQTTGGIEGQIVIDELAKIRVSRGDSAFLVIRSILGITRKAES